MRTGPDGNPRATREYQPANRREHKHHPPPPLHLLPAFSGSYSMKKSKTNNFCLLTIRQPYQRLASRTVVIHSAARAASSRKYFCRASKAYSGVSLEVSEASGWKIVSKPPALSGSFDGSFVTTFPWSISTSIVR
jgi:hypothetical protein